jgi:DnaJ-class molecular chaperone
LLSGIAVSGVMESLRGPCSMCDGSGWVSPRGRWALSFEVDECPHCHGDGKEPINVHYWPNSGW